MAKKNKLPVATSMPEMAKPSKESMEYERQWRAKEALETIEKAEDHKQDRDLMRDVKQLAKSKIKNLGKIC